MQTEGAATTLDIEVNEEERVLLLEYLQFLRFRAYMQQPNVATS